MLAKYGVVKPNGVGVVRIFSKINHINEGQRLMIFMKIEASQMKAQPPLLKLADYQLA